MIIKNFSFWGRSLLWLLVILLMIIFMYEHITSHYIFWKDPMIWFFPILINKTYISWDLSRVVAHLLNDAPMLVAMQVTSNIKALAYVFSATVWFWYLVSFLISFFYILKKDERYLSVLFPIILSATTKSFLYSEIHFISILGLPALFLFISNKEKNLFRQILLAFLLVGLGFTHQSVIFFYISIVLFLLLSKDISLFPGKQRVLPLFISLMMFIYNLTVIFVPNAEVCDVCISDFKKTLFNFEAYWSVWVFLAFYIPLYYISRKGLKFLIPFLVIYGYFYSTSIEKVNYTELFVQWNGRVHIIIIFSIMCFIALFLKSFKDINHLKRIITLTPIFCCLSILSSFSYIQSWKKIKESLVTVSNRDDKNKPLVVFTATNPDFKMEQVNYEAILVARNIEELSIFLQLVEGKDEIRRMLIGNFDSKATVNAFDRLAELKQMGVTFSQPLRDCLEDFKAQINEAACILKD